MVYIFCCLLVASIMTPLLSAFSIGKGPCYDCFFRTLMPALPTLFFVPFFNYGRFLSFRPYLFVAKFFSRSRRRLFPLPG